VIPATFWLLFEILSDADLYNRAKDALDTTRYPDGSLDSTKLINHPLFQSAYAEVLRLHTASMLTRTVKKTHELDSWTLKRDQTVVVSSHVEHHSAYWNDVDSSGRSRPADTFWAERFLTPEGQFSLDGKQGRYMPYGMGEHMCPGRHFAKYEMLLTFAVFVDRFEIELESPKGWRPENDLSRYGFGAVHPKQKVEAKIRLRR
jgi:cytochrome P450